MQRRTQRQSGGCASKRGGSSGPRIQETNGTFFINDYARIPACPLQRSRLLATMQLGITPPISLSPPTPRDLQVSRTLVEELHLRQVYETPQDGRARLVGWPVLYSCSVTDMLCCRELVLGRLNTLVKQFVYESSIAHGLSEAKAREA